MKTSGKKLDFKQLLIDHGEKLGMGLIGLFVLLALMTGRWSKFETHPQEIIQKATTAKQEIHLSTWPDTERQQYPPNAGLHAQVAQIFEPIDIAKYNYRGYGLSFPLRVQEEPVRTPELQKVDQMIASADRAVLLKSTAASFMYGEGMAIPWDGQGPQPKADETKIDGEAPPGIEKFDIYNRSRGAGAVPGMPMGPGAASGYLPRPGYPAGPGAGPGYPLGPGAGPGYYSGSPASPALPGGR